MGRFHSMKKSIVPTNSTQQNDILENMRPVGSLEELNSQTDCSDNTEEQTVLKKNISLDFSFSSLISVIFTVFLIVALSYRFIFPTLNSFEANISHKKIGTSIVYNYFNLLQNSNYDDALKLLDVGDSDYNVNSLMGMLEQQLGTTDIVDCDVINVQDNSDYSIVNTIVSYMNQGIVKSQNQSILVKNTPKGWKISLNGIIKKFNIDPVSATFNDSFTLTLKDIEYCVEGINLNLVVHNNKYKEVQMKGNISLKTTEGTYQAEVDSKLKPKVNYNHNLLFKGATGEPIEVNLEFEGNGYNNAVLPVKILNK